MGIFARAVPPAFLGLLVLAPPLLLLLGWRSLRRARPSGADTCAWLAGVCVLLLVVFEVLFVVSAVLGGWRPARFDPGAWLPGAAILAYPPTLWFFAHALGRAAALRGGRGRPRP